MKFSNRYIFIFITIIVVICAAILTFASVGLQPFQKANRERERMSQILQASGYFEVQDVIGFYNQVAKDTTIKGEKGDLPLIKVKSKSGEIVYVIELSGKGLWGPIWGFMAIKSDGKTVNGAVFDHKSETPGLGAEISTLEFMSQFEGKLLFDDQGSFQGIIVKKGGLLESEKTYGVDAVSGGTITSKGLEEMIVRENPDLLKKQKSLTPYIPFFKSLQSNTTTK